MDFVACEINLLDFALDRDQYCTVVVYGFSRNQKLKKNLDNTVNCCSYTLKFICRFICRGKSNSTLKKFYCGGE